MAPLGIIACGHEETARAAEQILQSGGNAFDAIVAAHYAACVAEPILASLGGGGFLLAHTHDGADVLYDFFTQTPALRLAQDACDFYPIHADFGTTRQEFHIGMGSVAVPGSIKGMFAIQQDLCTLPMSELVAPAQALARNGIPLNSFQAYILDIIKPILLASPATRSVYANSDNSNGVLGETERLRFLPMADLLQVLAREGDSVFYQGELAHEIDRLSREQGGHLRLQDLTDYQVIKRKPLTVDYRHAKVVTNPPPSSGGILIAFALKILDSAGFNNEARDSSNILSLIAEVMSLTNKARLDLTLDSAERQSMLHILDQSYLQQYQREIQHRSQCLRGTTHMSVIDSQGNLASMTVSNGEGCGHIIPDTGVMLNNMLGEEDLNPHGFHQWPASHRMTSMMSPSAVFLADGTRIALGSGGSNRLRTAILQVLINLIDYHMSIEDAVTYPRIHHENGQLNLEQGFQPATLETLITQYPNSKVWENINLYFGGAHCVMQQGTQLIGAGDPRRGGVCILVESS